MLFLKLLLNSGLIFIVATASNNIIPIHYNIKLVPYIENNIFYGECNISIHILHETKVINLYLEEQCIIEVELSTSMQKLEFDTEIMIYKPKYFYDTKTHIVNLDFTDKLSSGNYTLNIKYTGSIADYGGFTIFDIKEYKGTRTWAAATHSQTNGARRLFPCFDRPELEATFNISILHYRYLTVLSNMPVRETEIRGHEMWTHFDTTPVMSTYLVSTIMTRFLSIFIQNEEGIMWARDLSTSCLSFAYNIVKDITLHLETEWKRLKNVSNVNHVVIPDFEDKDMVNLGIILYKETDIIYNEMIDSAARKIEVARLVSHKVAQEWFCNLINPFWPSLLWLNKGLGRLLGMYAVNKVFPNYRIMDLFIVHFQHEMLRLDADYYMPFILQNNELFESFRYIKASIILRMMQHAISEEIFWKGIHFYAYESDLYDVNLLISISRPLFDAQVDENQEKFKPNLLSSMDAIESWNRQKHYPIIKVTRNYNDPEGSTKVTIKNFNTSEFCISITFTTQKYPNFDNTLPRYWLNKAPNILFNLGFKEDGWMIFNLQQTGYYRVNYDLENWRRITDYLNSENYIKIHVLNRAQLIDDAFNFMIIHQLNSSVFWNLTNYLSRETDYVAWYPMFKALECMSSVFPLPKKEVDDIKKRVQKTLNALLKEIKYEEIDDKDELRICLRQETAKWACILDDLDCKKEANYKLEQHLKYPETQKLLPCWKEWIFCKGLMTVSTKRENFIWQTVYHMGMEKPETKFLEFLACSEDTETIIDLFNIHLRNEQIFTNPKYHINGYLFTIAKHANNYEVLKHILSNFYKIKPKQVSAIVAITVIINNLYDKDQLNKDIAKFVIEEENKAKQAATATYLKIYKEENLSEKEKINKQLNDAEQLAIKMESKIKIRCDQIDNNINYLQNLI